MDYRLKAYSIYEFGSRTDAEGNLVQEDSIFPLHNESVDADRLFIVCDGMGGNAAGEIASSTVCTSLSRSILKYDPEGDFTIEDLKDALGEAFEALDAVDNHAEKKMGTTLAMLKFYDKGYITAHIGDSRVYQIRPGVDTDSTRILFKTEDHSLVNSLIKKGQLTGEEALTSPKRHVITRAMQPNLPHRPKADVHISSDIKPGDYFVVCSDGFLENIDEDNLKYVFSQEGGNDKNKMALLNRSSQNTRDNCSALIIHITDVIMKPTQSGVTNNSFGFINNFDSGNATRSQSKFISTAGKTALFVSERTKKFIRTRKEKNDIWDLIVKYLLALMGILIVIMIIYYSFLRVDEMPPKAGQATGETVIEEEMYSYEEDKEEYGYETQPKKSDNTEDKEQTEDLGDIPIDLKEGLDIDPGNDEPVEDKPAPQPTEPAPQPQPTPQPSGQD